MKKRLFLPFVIRYGEVYKQATLYWDGTCWGSYDKAKIYNKLGPISILSPKGNNLILSYENRTYIYKYDSHNKNGEQVEFARLDQLMQNAD